MSNDLFSDTESIALHTPTSNQLFKKIEIPNRFGIFRVRKTVSSHWQRRANRRRSSSVVGLEFQHFDGAFFPINLHVLFKRTKCTLDIFVQKFSAQKLEKANEIGDLVLVSVDL